VQVQADSKHDLGLNIRRRKFVPFMLLSCVTLGLYSAYLVLAQSSVIGQLVGRTRFSFAMTIVLTIVTLGIFPGIYVVVLAFDLQRYSRSKATTGRQPFLGAFVLSADILSLVTAIASGGLGIAVSIAAWSYGCWLLFKEVNLYADVDA
jgi:Domain of unknown function (DUF4234)